VRAAPAVSRANLDKESAHEHTGSAETLRPSLRNGFTAYFELSPVTGFLATVAPEKRWLLRDLTPAPGCQDHTTSPSAFRTVRQWCGSRPPHPVPTFATMANAPLCGPGWHYVDVILVSEKPNSFFAGRAGQRGQISACAKLGHVNHPPESSNFVRACNGRVRKHRFDGGIRKARKRWRLNCSQNIQSAARSSQDFQYSWRSYVKLWAYYGTGEQYPREPREGGFVCTGCYRDLGFPCYRPSRTTGCNTRMRGQLRKGSAK